MGLHPNRHVKNKKALFFGPVLAGTVDGHNVGIGRIRS